MRSVLWKRRGPSPSGEVGTIVATTLLVLGVLSLIGLALLDLSVRDVQVSTNLSKAAQSLYAAEAGTESAYQQIKILTSLGNLNAAAGTAVNAPVATFPNYTFSTFTVQALFVNPQRQSITTGPFQGLTGMAQNYLVTSEVTATNQSRARVVQVVQTALVGLFQFAVFYDKLLEIFAAEPMTLTGRVHSNSDTYTGDYVKLDSYLTAAGNLYNYRYDSGTQPCSPGTCTGPGGPMWQYAQIKNAAGTYVTFDHDSRSTNPAWASWALSTYNGLVRDAALGVTALNLPLNLAGGETPHQIIERGSSGDSATLQQQKLYWQADYRMLVNSDGSITVKTGPFGSETTSSSSTSSFLTKDITFADARESKCMDAAQIDVGRLRQAGAFPFTAGILYVSSSRTTTNSCGYSGHTPVVRLMDGAQLPSSTYGGFTVVSDNPIYIQGNYNTTSKVPAAVMGDATTILSNNWGPNGSDSKGSQSSSSRPATSTTINAAIATGNVPTIPGSRFSGGVENQLRLLENWSGDTLTYTGSIVDLWQSQKVTGSWSSSYYDPPHRNFSFDTSFYTKLPPGTPTAHVTQMGWWHQE